MVNLAYPNLKTGVYTGYHDSFNRCCSFGELPQDRLKENLRQLWRGDTFPKPKDILEALSQVPKLHFLFNELAPDLGYSNYAHSFAALTQRQKYYSGFPKEGSAVSRRVFDLGLALHDIGKFVPGDELSSVKTIKVIASLQEVLSLSDQELAIISSLVKDDPLGNYFRNCLPRPITTIIPQQRAALLYYRLSLDAMQKTLQEYTTAYSLDTNLVSEQANVCCSRLRENAALAGMTVADFFLMTTVFYDCDTSSYTVDAVTPSGKRCKPSLEYMFELRVEAGEVSLSAECLTSKILVFDQYRGHLKRHPVFQDLLDRLTEELYLGSFPKLVGENVGITE